RPACRTYSTPSRSIVSTIGTAGMGNPAIFPLIYNRGSKDVILIHINPIERKKLPKTAAEIFNRVNEISFNSSLMREMLAVAFVTKLIDDNVLDRSKYS